MTESNPLVSPVGALIARLETIKSVQQALEPLRALAADLCQEDREAVAAELRQIAGALAPLPPPAGKFRLRHGEVPERVVAFFRARGNAPAAVPEISADANLAYGSIRAILNKEERNRGGFVRKGRGLWALADSELVPQDPDPEETR